MDEDHELAQQEGVGEIEVAEEFVGFFDGGVDGGGHGEFGVLVAPR